MTDEDPWGKVSQTFASAQATIRGAMRAVAEEHRVLRGVDDVDGGGPRPQKENQFPVLNGRVWPGTARVELGVRP